MFKTPFVISKFQIPQRSFVPEFIAGVAIWSVFVPVAILHAWTWVYQEIYFGIYDIPKLHSKDYISFDRNQLTGLTRLQKLACAYCAYVNGVTAWIKAVVNRTEVYSCAIKHRTPITANEHQKDFFPFEDFA